MAINFDNYMPWKGMRRVILNPDGSREGYLYENDSNYWAGGEDEDDPTEQGDEVDWNEVEDNDQNVMVEIPKFWYKADLSDPDDEEETGFDHEWDDNDRVFQWKIANKPHEDYDIHPAFVRDGVEYDYQYIGAFESYFDGTKMRSLPNKAGSDGETMEEFRSRAQANGPGWEQNDFLLICAVQLLYLVEYGHFDSQTEIGEGIVDDGDYHDTGETLTLGNFSGADGDPTDQTNAISYRGIENLWGNRYQWADGANLNDYRLWLADHDFESDKFTEPYQDTGIDVLSDSSSWIKNIHFDNTGDNIDKLDYGFMASEAGGSENSYLHDFWFIDDGEKALQFSGNRFRGSEAGAFFWFGSRSSDYSIGSHSARLARLL